MEAVLLQYRQQAAGRAGQQQTRSGAAEKDPARRGHSQSDREEGQPGKKQTPPTTIPSGTVVTASGYSTETPRRQPLFYPMYF